MKILFQEQEVKVISCSKSNIIIKNGSNASFVPSFAFCGRSTISITLKATNPISRSIDFSVSTRKSMFVTKVGTLSERQVIDIRKNGETKGRISASPNLKITSSGSINAGLMRQLNPLSSANWQFVKKIKFSDCFLIGCGSASLVTECVAHRRRRSTNCNMGRHKKSRSNRNNCNETKEVEVPDRLDADLLYNVEKSAVLGRYLTAKRDLKPGEIVLTDEKVVVGPCQESKPMCIGCFTNINLDEKNTYKRCGTCSWPLCSENCPGSYKTSAASYPCHSAEECEFLSESAVKNTDISELKTCFYAITPLRLLMVKLFKPQLWKIVEKMETHTESRKKNVKLWKMNEELAVEKIQKVFGLSAFTAHDIHFACGVLEVNAFEVVLPGEKQPLRAIYPNACLFSHDCVPNTSHSNGEGFALTVRTTKFIPKNSPITISYTYTLQSTLNRRKHLQDTKFFSCCCARCRDITEFGLYCSALKCPACKIGSVLPINPLDVDSDWECHNRKCSGYKVFVSAIIQIVGRLTDELDSVNGNDIEGYENFLRKYSDVLHENHHLNLSALHSLFQLYGKTEGYIIDKLTEEQLERKIQICRKLLRVFEKLEPGMSKQRGILLYELQAPLMVILRRRFEESNIPKKELKQRLREVNKCLEEACLILGGEWKSSPEGVMAAAAKEALESMRNWESVIDML